MRRDLVGISHFHQVALEHGLSGDFKKLSQENIQVPENTKYIISWVTKDKEIPEI